MIVLFVKTPSATWRVQISETPLTENAVRAAIAKQHSIPQKRQRYFIDPELSVPIEGDAAFARLAHGSTIHFHEAGDSNGVHDEEPNSSSTSLSSRPHESQAQLPAAAHESLDREPSTSNLAPLLPTHATSGEEGTLSGPQDGNRNSLLAHAYPMALDSGMDTENDNERDALTHLPLTHLPISPRGYGTVPQVGNARPNSSEVHTIQRAYSFAWGLRSLCLVDGFMLYGSLLFPLCPPLLRALTLALLWGPPLSFAAVSTFAPRSLILAMAYHFLACVVPLAMAWPIVMPNHSANGSDPASSAGGGGSEDGGGAAASTASVIADSEHASACATGWLLLPPIFHSWALSLFFRFHARVSTLTPSEKQLLRRIFLLR